ncbi:hypothetical protein GPECTOR_1g301 [Gonium pectorale]|uniref:Uncharacterized protein n=1 Tax=Gonium pectorale TaxID=33097 RepID=A0A150H2P1_GONPE|nr:hypothetical protein GPECTOR_1g301 [Gonium pectorale]|eukprot:KXZ56341.1 hypothetical protein GPECTOR_1g301 [Gonium pectorale]
MFSLAGPSLAAQPSAISAPAQAAPSFAANAIQFGEIDDSVLRAACSSGGDSSPGPIGGQLGRIGSAVADGNPSSDHSSSACAVAVEISEPTATSGQPCLGSATPGPSPSSASTPSRAQAAQPLFEPHDGFIIGTVPAPGGARTSANGSDDPAASTSASQPLQLCLRYAYGSTVTAEELVRMAPGPYRSQVEVGEGGGGLSGPLFAAWREEVEKAWYAKLKQMPAWQPTAQRKAGEGASAVAAQGADGGSSGGARQQPTTAAVAARHHHHHHVASAPGAALPFVPYGAVPYQVPMVMYPVQMVPVWPQAAVVPVGPMVPMGPGAMPYGMPAAGWGAGAYGSGYGGNGAWGDGYPAWGQGGDGYDQPYYGAY